MNEKLSVIIPIYNVEPYLRQCLDSIKNQTYKNLEIILIDDGSPDKCGMICDEYAAKDERIIVIHKENEGVNVARNLGIKKASGNWIAFVDSDDWLDLNFYEQMVYAARGKNPDIVCACGHIRENPNSRKVIRFFSKPCFYNDSKHISDLQANITKTGLPWDKLYRTELLRENDLSLDPNVKAFDDYLFNFQVFERAKSVTLCSTIGYHYRQVEASIANRFNISKPQYIYEFLTKLNTYAESYGVNEKMRDGIHGCTIGTIPVAMNCYFFHPANTKKRSEVYHELIEMISLPYYQEAIQSKSNRYLSRNQVILKYALRFKWGGGIAHPVYRETKTQSLIQGKATRLQSIKVCH